MLHVSNKFTIAFLMSEISFFVKLTFELYFDSIQWM